MKHNMQEQHLFEYAVIRVMPRVEREGFINAGIILFCKSRQFLHRGIAARQFQRTFVLADGMEVQKADLRNGLLSIDLARPEPARVVRTIQIAEHE